MQSPISHLSHLTQHPKTAKVNHKHHSLTGIFIYVHRLFSFHHSTPATTYTTQPICAYNSPSIYLISLLHPDLCLSRPGLHLLLLFPLQHHCSISPSLVARVQKIFINFFAISPRYIKYHRHSCSYFSFTGYHLQCIIINHPISTLISFPPHYICVFFPSSFMFS